MSLKWIMGPQALLQVLVRRMLSSGSALPENQTSYTRNKSWSPERKRRCLPTTSFSKEHKLTLFETVLRLRCASGTKPLSLYFLLRRPENCCSEADRWSFCCSLLPLRYLCQLIFPLCLAVVCETGPHHCSLINGAPSLRLVLAPPSSSNRKKKMKTHSWIFYKSALLKLAPQPCTYQRETLPVCPKPRVRSLS